MKKLSVIFLVILSVPMAFADPAPMNDGDREACLARARNETDKQARLDHMRVCETTDSFNQARANQQNNSGNSNNVPYNECTQVYSRARSSITTTGATPTPGKFYTSETQAADAVPPSTPAISAALNPDLKPCKGYEAMSRNFGTALSGTDRKMSQDGKIFCVQKSGITADWESCTSALSMYNTIVVAEAAMQVFQSVQTNNTQNQIQNDVNAASTQGNIQNAAYDAQIKAVESAKALNQQQAMAYTAAVAALYSKIQSWIKETPEAVIQRGCGVNAPPQPVKAAAPGPTPEYFASVEVVPRDGEQKENCIASARKATTDYAGFVFAKRDAKAAFQTAAMLFAAQGIMAGIKASQLDNIAKKVEEAKVASEDPYNPATFELCQVNATDPRCATAGTKTTGSGLQDGGFSFGDNFGNNAFNPLGDPEDMTNGTTAPGVGDSRVADVNSPFADDAKKANGILDPAAAASTRSGGPLAGGGGAGAGLPGGGSASLGAGTPGPDDSKKENDIKANKADGKYNIAGGGAFKAISPMKEENPFANLFGGKGGGGLEEERGPASGDIDGKDSGLFAKISKRYGQVQADKRIEAKNLDE
jgi:hypothetical protein